MELNVVAALNVALFIAGMAYWIRAVATGRTAQWFGGPGRLVRWPMSRWDFAFATFITVGLSYLGPIAAIKLAGIEAEAVGTTNAGRLVSGYAFHFSVIAGCLLAWLRPFGRPPEASTPLAQTLGTSVATFVLLFPPLLLLLNGWDWLLKACGIAAPLQDLIEVFRNTRDPGVLAALIVLAVVVAPVSEELFFRAGIFRFFAMRLPAKWAAVVSSAVFVLPHANLLSSLPLFLLGLALCFVYRRTGRLLAAIALHALFNLHTVFEALFMPS